VIRELTLKPFQEEALELMVGRGNALLALTMGLGKTVTTIAAIEDLHDNGAVSTGLVIVPSSLKYQWQREIKRFTGQLALVIDGDKAKRHRLYGNAFRFRYVITNYESIVNDWVVVRDLPLDYIVCDEATALKSMTSKRSKKVKFLAKRTPITIALTGQPIENRPEELFSIMEFVDPDTLGSFEKFDKTFIVRDNWGKPRRYRNLDKLAERMEDVMYRKSRADVADQFPQINTTVLPFYLSPVEATMYEAVRDHVLDLLTNASTQFGSSFNLAAHYGKEIDPMAAQMRGDIMSGVTILRQISDDANLVLQSAANFDAGGGTGSKLASELVADGWFDKVPKVSSKRKIFAEFLGECLDDPDSKVVAFSTFKGMLHNIAEDTKRLTKATSLTGDMKARDRDLSIQKFKQDPHTRLFLSSDAGGYGVDLPNANHLVSLDLPWSTGSYEQREARIIRISSEFTQVFITMILAHGSIDMRMQEMIDEKSGIATAWLDGKSDDKGGFSLNLGSLTEFLSSAELRSG
jgi:SNF2 family DNA or RNA helicase